MMTDPHFLRCIKPNHSQAAGVFTSELVQEQLHSSGVIEAVRIRRDGFSARPKCEEFLNLYRVLCFASTMAPDTPETWCKAVMETVRERLDEEAKSSFSWAIGKTRVLMKWQTKKMLDGRLHALQEAALVIQRSFRALKFRRRVRSAIHGYRVKRCCTDILDNDIFDFVLLEELTNLASGAMSEEKIRLKASSEQMQLKSIAEEARRRKIQMDERRAEEEKKAEEKKAEEAENARKSEEERLLAEAALVDGPAAVEEDGGDTDFEDPIVMVPEEVLEEAYLVASEDTSAMISVVDSGATLSLRQSEAEMRGDENSEARNQRRVRQLLLGWVAAVFSRLSCRSRKNIEEDYIEIRSAQELYRDDNESPGIDVGENLSTAEKEVLLSETPPCEPSPEPKVFNSTPYKLAPFDTDEYEALDLNFVSYADLPVGVAPLNRYGLVLQYFTLNLLS